MSRYRTAELAANTWRNADEMQRGIKLAQRFEDVVVAVNVGNEALVDWNDHMVPVEQVIAYVRLVKAAIDQPVTVAENYAWWIRDGAAPGGRGRLSWRAHLPRMGRQDDRRGARVHD